MKNAKFIIVLFITEMWQSYAAITTRKRGKMMKPRMIDSNKLVIETKKCLSLCQTFRGYTAEAALKHFLLLIDEQPTAYDVTSVVKQLEECSVAYCKEYGYAEDENVLYLPDAIEIVRMGGAE